MPAGLTEDRHNARANDVGHGESLADHIEKDSHLFWQHFNDLEANHGLGRRQLIKPSKKLHLTSASNRPCTRQQIGLRKPGAQTPFQKPP